MEKKQRKNQKQRKLGRKIQIKIERKFDQINFFGRKKCFKKKKNKQNLIMI